jgi:hypothetical protein
MLAHWVIRSEKVIEMIVAREAIPMLSFDLFHRLSTYSG